MHKQGEGLIRNYSEEFENILEEMGIVSKSERWAEAIEIFNENMFHQSELAVIYKEKLDEAIKCVGTDSERALKLMSECYEIVSKIGTPDNLRQFIRYRCYTNEICKKYDKSFSDLFEWLKLIPKDHEKEFSDFKDRYNALTKSYKFESLNKSYPFFDFINNLIEENSVELQSVGIIPNAFNLDDLASLPF